jgi:hypothetical protein
MLDLTVTVKVVGDLLGSPLGCVNVMIGAPHPLQIFAVHIYDMLQHLQLARGHKDVDLCLFSQFQWQS